nr:hypothetical protein HmN_000684300 [Hymenolepis microstoma]
MLWRQSITGWLEVFTITIALAPDLTSNTGHLLDCSIAHKIHLFSLGSVVFSSVLNSGSSFFWNEDSSLCAIS